MTSNAVFSSKQVRGGMSNWRKHLRRSSGPAPGENTEARLRRFRAGMGPVKICHWRSRPSVSKVRLVDQLRGRERSFTP